MYKRQKPRLSRKPRESKAVVQVELEAQEGLRMEPLVWAPLPPLPGLEEPEELTQLWLVRF